MPKRTSMLILALLFAMIFDSMESRAQQLGMSFSFFFPRNGYFSVPISPFSFRGVGLNPSKYFSLESGFTLYRMSGMTVTDIPFETRDPLMGPFFSLFVPAQAVLKLPVSNFVFSVKGGGFAFYNFDNHIMYGNLDRAIREFEQWEVANADFRFDNELGYGLIFGAEVVVYFTKQFGVNAEVNYLSGGAPLNLRGTYTGGDGTGALESVTGNYKDSKLDFTGWEITLGILFSTR